MRQCWETGGKVKGQTFKLSWKIQNVICGRLQGDTRHGWWQQGSCFFPTLKCCTTKFDISFTYKPTSMVNKEGSKKWAKQNNLRMQNKKWKWSWYQLFRAFEKGDDCAQVCHSVSSSLLHWTFSFISKSHKTKEWMEGKTRKWWHAGLMLGHWLNVSSHFGIQPPCKFYDKRVASVDPSSGLGFHQC